MRPRAEIMGDKPCCILFKAVQRCCGKAVPSPEKARGILRHELRTEPCRKRLPPLPGKIGVEVILLWQQCARLESSRGGAGAQRLGRMPPGFVIVGENVKTPRLVGQMQGREVRRRKSSHAGKAGHNGADGENRLQPLARRYDGTDGSKADCVAIETTQCLARTSTGALPSPLRASQV